MKLCNDNKGEYNINFVALLFVIFFSVIVWGCILEGYKYFMYDEVEIKYSSGIFFAELKNIGVPEPLKLIEYNLEKGIKNKNKTRIHLKFAYTLPKEDVEKYYKKEMEGNYWRLKKEENTKWIYEKENYQMTIVCLPENVWGVDVQFIE